MNVRIDLRRMIRPYFVLLAVFAGVFALIFICNGMLSGAVMAALWAVIGYFVTVRTAFRYVDPRSVYDITPARVTQSVKGKVIKELSLADGMRVHRRKGFNRYRAYLLYACVEIPKGAAFEEWKDSPDVILVPYHYFIRMSKLTRAYEGAIPI